MAFIQKNQFEKRCNYQNKYFYFKESISVGNCFGAKGKILAIFFDFGDFGDFFFFIGDIFLKIIRLKILILLILKINI